MEAIRFKKTVEKDGEIILKDLPYKKGQNVEMILISDPSQSSQKKLTGARLLNSGLVGLWKNREDITDSLDFARALRDKAQRRKG